MTEEYQHSGPLEGIEQRYQADIEAHKARPCLRDQEIDTGSWDCGSPDSLRAARFTVWAYLQALGKRTPWLRS